MSFNNRNFNNNPLNELITEIRRANSLKEVFLPEKYALADGWAYKTANVLLARSRDNSKKGMNVNQIRKIYNELRSIADNIKMNNKLDDDSKNRIMLIMPQVAYAKGRGVVTQEFYNLMKECISLKKIKQKEDFISFFNFFKAVVAYSSMVKNS